MREREFVEKGKKNHIDRGHIKILVPIATIACTSDKNNTKIKAYKNE